MVVCCWWCLLLPLADSELLVFFGSLFFFFFLAGDPCMLHFGATPLQPWCLQWWKQPSLVSLSLLGFLSWLPFFSFFLACVFAFQETRLSCRHVSVFSGHKSCTRNSTDREIAFEASLVARLSSELFFKAFLALLFPALLFLSLTFPSAVFMSAAFYTAGCCSGQKWANEKVLWWPFITGEAICQKH